MTLYYIFATFQLVPVWCISWPGSFLYIICSISKQVGAWHSNRNNGGARKTQSEKLSTEKKQLQFAYKNKALCFAM